MRSLCFISDIMEYKAKPTGRPSDYYVIGLFGAGGIFWILPNFQKSFAAFYQFIAILMFSAAMYLLIRYRLTVFRFRVEGRNGDGFDIRAAMPEELDFVVEKSRGKGSLALARLSLGQLKSVSAVVYKELHDLTKDASLYKYYADMSPDEVVLVIFDDGERDIAMAVDLSQEMINFLKSVAKQNLSGSVS